MDLKQTLGNLRRSIAAGDATGTETLLLEAERLASIVPEIAIYMDGGLVQEVKRANDAPYVLHIHDHDVESTSSDVSTMTWPSGAQEDAVIFKHSSDGDDLEPSEEYWESLRNPVESEDFENDEDED